jgi:hypothetical protein
VHGAPFADGSGGGKQRGAAAELKGERDQDVSVLDSLNWVFGGGISREFNEAAKAQKTLTGECL